ncbi:MULTISPECIES: zinc ABC transporter substrate-binding protein [Pseudomonadaceae]|uniref:zinc ABC transporter substrate-binding protein n=1 Tax=Stutzerimonas stutzeri TaxID=316 RepID=UPI0015E2D49C|nr:MULTISPECIES: zinc ABC transporter substrate-binding protein [unclassified Pseudomonas]MBA1276236.1 zinc ABC transporter solute-binding protein [Stutzerimonas stutzeri]MBC8648745.1 zinc ABC transporter substrate-binding protein [Pseudomonas sp. MT4]QXY92721.1 zinc ABC transporter solute-binding protein [Pseudomonas sp. MTM4]
MFRLFSLPLLVTLIFLGSAPARAEVALVTSIKPLQLIAAAIQDGVGEPQVLLPAGASAHHYALRPSDVRQIRSADLFYWIGPDMEAFLEPLLKGREGPSVAAQSLPGLTLRHFGDEHAESHHGHDEHAHEADNHDHDAHEAHAADSHHDHAHRPGSLDAHLWLLPANALVIAANMAGKLAAVDPANAAHYQANLEGFRQRLDALDQRLTKRLSDTDKKPFFVFHEAYDYFEAAYGLAHTGVFAAGEAQPGARHVAEMRQRLEQAGPSCVFYEPPIRPRLADSLIRELPVQVAELDAMGQGIEATAGGYERLIENLGMSLVECLESL